MLGRVEEDIEMVIRKNLIDNDEEISSALLVELEKQSALALFTAQTEQLHAEKYIFKEEYHHSERMGWK